MNFREWLISESVYKWKIGPTGDKQITIDEITFVAANITKEVGKRKWNLGIVRNGKVDWFESGSTLAEIEQWIPSALQNERM